MHFAILGKNQEISLAELELVKPQNINRINEYMITFDTEYENLLSTLGGITKWGRVVAEKELAAFFEGKKILGVEKKELGLKFKKAGLIRRFKITEQQKTDLEIKKKGLEIIKFSSGYGVVIGYQNIPLYEAIDFQKPSRSMQMGMMPAKLTHILINIGILSTPLSPALGVPVKGGTQGEIHIYDPFAGSGTTGMLANFLGYDFIGSDIEAKHLSKNLPRRKTTRFHNPDKSLEFFQQDIFSSKSKHFEHPPFQGGIKGGSLTIVTEGRLGPIINKHADDQDIEAAELEVIELYRAFLATATKLKNSGELKTIVTTIPHYFRHENKTGQELFAYAQRLGRECNYIDEIYARPRQRVGRKILIFT